MQLTVNPKLKKMLGFFLVTLFKFCENTYVKICIEIHVVWYLTLRCLNTVIKWTLTSIAHIRTLSKRERERRI